MNRLVSCLAAALLLLRSLPAAGADPSALRVYVVVVDGLDPAEVGLATPTLSALKSAGTWYENSLSVMIAETLPNHVAMMTGVLPEKSGIVANDYSGGRMQDPSLLLVPTLVTRLETDCPQVNTATVVSKTYLYNIFKGGSGQKQADFHPDVEPKIPVSDHAPDPLTMESFLGWAAATPPPHFALVNLGDVDRSGHADPTGNSGVPALRRTVLEDTDALLGTFVQTLKAQGAWESTVLIVLSDHSMDWSLPPSFVSLGGALAAAGGGQLVQNGGAELVYLTDSSQSNVAAAAAAILTVPGVDRVLTKDTSPSLADFGLDHERSGQIVAFAKPGWRFSDPSNTSNPLPGNHGHGLTQRNLLLVTGGHPAVRSGTVATNPPATFTPPLGAYGSMSVAPTVAALFGLGDAAYDGTRLDSAFVGGVAPKIGPCGS